MYSASILDIDISHDIVTTREGPNVAWVRYVADFIGYDIHCAVSRLCSLDRTMH
jgi:hypothetical protein